ncbi:MAG: hypothetical protein M3416_02450 [Acidobacteriota bacterium]|nr:hypothetical protein [Acidobacteriota bacterium]
MKYICWSVAVLVALVQIGGRYMFIESDGISYLDLGLTYFRGDWGNALNAYWSPLFPLLLGAVMTVVKPSPYWEFTVVHVTNFAVFIGALFSFDFLLRQLRLYREDRPDYNPSQETGALPEWAWTIIGYTLFLWCGINTIGVTHSSPDTMVTAIIYLAAALTLRMRTRAATRRTAVALGAVLGLGYLAKAALLPVGCVFLLSCLLPLPPRRPPLARALLAAGVFLLICAPLVAALSLHKGRLTFGDSGRLNYSWSVNKNTRWLHWQGEVAGSGTPVHPTRKVQDSPVIYEFAEPVGGTYPVWFDPSYWYEGVRVYFDLRQQLAVFVPNLEKVLAMFYYLPSSKLITLLCLILFTASGARFRTGEVLRHWPVILPAVFGPLMYALVVVVSRYIGPFYVVFILALLAGVRLPEGARVRLALNYAVVLLVLCSLVAVAWRPARYAYVTAHKLAHGREPHDQWRIAEVLRKNGVRPGDGVGAVGYEFIHAWARVGRNKVIAEMPHELFLLTRRANEKSLQTFERLGVKAVVAAPELFLSNAPPEGWQQVEELNVYVHFPGQPGQP